MIKILSEERKLSKEILKEKLFRQFFVSMHTKGTDEWQVLQVCL